MDIAPFTIICQYGKNNEMIMTVDAPNSFAARAAFLSLVNNMNIEIDGEIFNIQNIQQLYWQAGHYPNGRIIRASSCLLCHGAGIVLTPFKKTCENCSGDGGFIYADTALNSIFLNTNTAESGICENMES